MNGFQFNKETIWMIDEGIRGSEFRRYGNIAAGIEGSVTWKEAFSHGILFRNVINVILSILTIERKGIHKSE